MHLLGKIMVIFCDARHVSYENKITGVSIMSQVTKITFYTFTVQSAIPRFCVEGLPNNLDFGYFVLIKNNKS